MPAHLATGEAVMLSANLSNKGKVVRRKAFLRLLDVRADAITRDGTDPLGLNDKGQHGDEKAGDGRYSVQYTEKKAFDEVELLFSVESPTFMREKRYHLAVHEPAVLRIEGKGDKAAAVAKVETAVMAEGATLEVWQGEGDARKPLQLKDGVYPLQQAEAPVFMKVEGKTRLGNLVSREFGPVYPPGVKPQPKAAPEKPAAPVDKEKAAAPPDKESRPSLRSSPQRRRPKRTIG